MSWLKAKLRSWLGWAEFDARLYDIERHFVTKRDAQGIPMETLADIPPDKRKERKIGLRGMSMEQRRAWLEATDGGRQIPPNA